MNIRFYLFISVLLTIFCILLLICFETLPFFSANDDYAILQQANLQLVREQYMTNSALLLNDQINPAQNISAIQASLPTFEAVQTGLLKGNGVYGLPPNPSDNVKTALLSSQSSYTALVAAYTTIISHPEQKPDQIQIAIIRQNDTPYLLNMYQVASLLQQEAEMRKLQLYLIKTAIIIVTLFLVIFKYLLLTRTVLKSTLQ